MFIIKESTGKIHNFGDNTLLIFIDETGHEELSDKNFPIFGFGGCIVTATDYEKQIVKPWEIVSSVFPANAPPLHASDIKPETLSSSQIKELASFFSGNQFGRFAEVVSNKTILQSKHKLMDIIAASIHQRIIDIAKWLPFDRVVMIFEESERTKEKMTVSFSQYNFTVDSKAVPIERFFMSKKMHEPGLIVADFTVHTAGATVLSKAKGIIQKNLDRKDFALIFAAVDRKYASFMEVSEILEK